jgi:hypothetical protein
MKPVKVTALFWLSALLVAVGFTSRMLLIHQITLAEGLLAASAAKPMNLPVQSYLANLKLAKCVTLVFIAVALFIFSYASLRRLKLLVAFFIDIREYVRTPEYHS